MTRSKVTCLNPIYADRTEYVPVEAMERVVSVDVPEYLKNAYHVLMVLRAEEVTGSIPVSPILYFLIPLHKSSPL